MSLLEMFLLAIGLAADATAVAGAQGVAARDVSVRDALCVAVFFGGAQALMPALGWLAGGAFASSIAGWGRWLTFVVLAGIGAKMIYEARVTSPEPDASTSKQPFQLKLLVALAVATSIDALAAGVTLGLRRVSILVACVIIGAVTALSSFVGVFVGRRFGARVGPKLDLAGGVVLIGLAIKAIAFDSSH